MTALYGDTVESVVASVGELPSMPEVVAEVLAISRDPATTMVQIADTIAKDPVLAAKILEISNSSYYGMRQHVGSLKLALVILGVREVQNIVLAVSMFQSFPASPTERLLGVNLRKHSAIVGALAKRLAEESNARFQGDDFIAGLLHDIGKLVLWNQMGKRYETIVNDAKGNDVALRNLERERLGFTHADASAAMASAWRLPDQITDAIWRHHSDGGADLALAKEPKLAAAIRIANVADLEALDQNKPELCVACRDDEAWETLGGVPAGDVSARLDLLRQYLSEIRGVPVPKF